MRTAHITMLILITLFSRIAYAQEPIDGEKKIEHPDFAIVVIPGNKSQEPNLSDSVIELLIAKFAGANLGLNFAGQEIFGIKNNEEIRQCFATEGCVRNVCVTKQMGRMLYGTIVKEKGKLAVQKAKGKKKVKGAKTTKPKARLSIDLTLFDAINNRIEMTWVCKSCASEEVYDKTVPEIADATVAILRKTPMIWAERMPSLRADEAFLGLQPQELEVIPPPPAPVEEEVGEEVRPEELKPVAEVVKTAEPKIKKGLDWHAWSGIALMSLGAGMVGTGGYFGVSANTSRANYEGTNIQRQAVSFRDESQSSAAMANTMFIYGGGALATGATLFLLDHFEIIHKNPKSPQAIIIPNPSGVSLNLYF